MKTSIRCLTLACTVALSACSLNPPYERPAIPVPAAWPQGMAYGDAAKPGETAAKIQWQDFYQDAALRRLIALALDNNRDLRQVVLNVEAYRAQHQIQASALVPNIGVGAGIDHEYLPKDLAISGMQGNQDTYSVSVGMSSYEVDIFGRVHSLTQHALQEFLASEDVQRGVQISLIGAVANAYLTWQDDREQLQLTLATVANYRQMLQRVERNERAGITSALAVRQARSVVAQADTQRLVHIRKIAQDANLLALLLGTEIPRDLPPAPSDISTVIRMELPVGMPSDLLLHRPDIRAAEHDLMASDANIGVARAAFFPSIQLTAGAGTSSASLAGLFNAGSGAWSYFPTINLPIFNGGRLKANMKYAEVEKKIEVARYEKAIQTAFREVSDGLAARGTYAEQLSSQESEVKNDEEYYAYAQERFKQGITTYLTVLDAQRTLFVAKQQLITARSNRVASEVMLYKALGGGWLPDPVAAEAAVNTVAR